MEIYIEQKTLDQLNIAFASGIPKHSKNTIIEFLKEHDLKEAYLWIENNSSDYWRGIDNGFIGINKEELPKICGKYINFDSLVFAKKIIDKCNNTEYKKIPEICGNASYCIRGHMGHKYYRIDNREKCPKICPLNIETV